MWLLTLWIVGVITTIQMFASDNALDAIKSGVAALMIVICLCTEVLKRHINKKKKEES